MLHTIRKEELNTVARILTEGFRNYPLYNAIYSDPKRKIRCMYDLTRIYCQIYTTYVTDDLSFIACIKKPEDKPDGNPYFKYFSILLDVIFHSRIIEFKRLMDYINLSSKMEAMYRKPEDWEIEIIYKNKNAKNLPDLQTILEENFSDHPIYCETHSPAHVRLYGKYGFKVVGSADFYGITHYALRRDLT